MHQMVLVTYNVSTIYIDFAEVNGKYIWSFHCNLNETTVHHLLPGTELP